MVLRYSSASGMLMPVRVVNPAMYVRYRYNLVARFMHELRADSANVSRALNHHTGFRGRHLESLDCFVDDKKYSAASGLTPPDDPPRSIGFPVTTAVTVCRACIE